MLAYLTSAPLQSVGLIPPLPHLYHYQPSLGQAPKSLETELPFHLGHKQVKTVELGEGNTLMEAVGLLSQTGKGNLGMLPSGSGYRNQLLRQGDRMVPAQSLWYDWNRR